MNVIKLFCIASSAALLISCSDNVSINQIGRRIVSEPYENPRLVQPADSIKGSALEGVIGVGSVEDSIAILFLPEDSYVCRAVNMNTLDYVDLINVGRGPNEIISGLFSAKRKVEGATLIDIVALNEHYIMTIDLGRTMSDKQISVVETTPLYPTARGSFIVDDQVLSKVVMDEDGAYYSLKMFDSKTMAVNRTDYIFGKDEFVAYNDPLFVSCNRIKPDRTRLCMGMFFFDEIEIYDIEGLNHISCTTDKHSKSGSIIKKMKDGGQFGECLYYKCVDVTNDYIYALHYGFEYEEIDSAPLVHLHVFSWDGVLEDMFAVAEPLTTIAVSEDGRTMYGWTDNEVLYKYILDEVSK